MKKFWVFIGGAALGAYVMYSEMFRKVAKKLIDDDKEEKKEESATE